MTVDALRFAKNPHEHPHGCADHPMCDLVRNRLHPLVPDGCLRAFAISAHVGEEIPADADVWCAECGGHRSEPGSGTWRYSWSGQPHCGTCLSVLELSGELRCFPWMIKEDLWS